MEHSSVGTRRRKKREGSRSPRGWLRGAFEIAQGGLILGLVIAAPWLFGCTEDWSVRLMNCGAFLVGVIALGLQLTNPTVGSGTTIFERWTKRSFIVVNFLLLLFTIAATLNARASFSIEQQAFAYRDNLISWLPTTYDSRRTLQFLVNNLALFAFFWGTRAWLQRSSAFAQATEEHLNRRLRLFLWVFVANGFLVALQGLLQRLSGSAKLLWWRTSYWPDPASNFGPFSYRGNAVDYLNLVWPVTFGLWYLLTHRRTRISARLGDGPELLLLPMFLVTLAASVATLSRGGLIVAGILVVALVVRLLFSKTSRVWKVTLLSSLAVVLALAAALFGDVLIKRFRLASSDQLGGRTEIYRNAQKIAEDFPWFGSGPGTFMSIYYLYRETPDQDWAAFVHDDWLETRVTFGRVGFGLVLLQFGLLFLWSYGQRDRWISPVLSFCLLLSICGCLVHAKADFPFQTYGVVFTFVIVCVLLTSCVQPARETPLPEARGNLS